METWLQWRSSSLWIATWMPKAPLIALGLKPRPNQRLEATESHLIICDFGNGRRVAGRLSMKIQLARCSESIFFSVRETNSDCVVSASFSPSRLLNSIKLRRSAQACDASDSGKSVFFPLVSVTSAPVRPTHYSQFKVETHKRNLSKWARRRPTGWLRRRKRKGTVAKR